MILNKWHSMVAHHPWNFRWIAASPVRGFLVILVLLFLWGPTVCVFADDSGVSWSNLSSEERKVLRRYSKRWEKLSPSQQRRLQQGAREWTHMNPEQREHIRSRYDRFRQLPPAEQEKIRRTHRWYENLPQDQKTDLKRRWKKRSREDNRRRRRD